MNNTELRNLSVHWILVLVNENLKKYCGKVSTLTYLQCVNAFVALYNKEEIWRCDIFNTKRKDATFASKMMAAIIFPAVKRLSGVVPIETLKEVKNMSWLHVFQERCESFKIRSLSFWCQVKKILKKKKHPSSSISGKLSTTVSFVTRSGEKGLLELNKNVVEAADVICLFEGILGRSIARGDRKISSSYFIHQ